MGNVTASWYISLDCECPKCGFDIDIARDPDFWGDGIQVGQDCKDYEVSCPKCKHEFKVDMVY